MNFYFDECGQTGDLAKRGALASFADQRIFSLAAIGLEDEASFALEIEKLKTKHGIQSAELKSSMRRDRSGFTLELHRPCCPKVSITNIAPCARRREDGHGKTLPLGKR